MKENIKNKFIMVRIDDNKKEYYKNLCESLGFTLSKRIISLIEKDINLLNKIKNSHE